MLKIYRSLTYYDIASSARNVLYMFLSLSLYIYIYIYIYIHTHIHTCYGLYVDRPAPLRLCLPGEPAGRRRAGRLGAPGGQLLLRGPEGMIMIMIIMIIVIIMINDDNDNDNDINDIHNHSHNHNDNENKHNKRTGGTTRRTARPRAWPCRSSPAGSRRAESTSSCTSRSRGSPSARARAACCPWPCCRCSIV